MGSGTETSESIMVEHNADEIKKDMTVKMQKKKKNSTEFHSKKTSKSWDTTSVLRAKHQKVCKDGCNKLTKHCVSHMSRSKDVPWGKKYRRIVEKISQRFQLRLRKLVVESDSYGQSQRMGTKDDEETVLVHKEK